MGSVTASVTLHAPDGSRSEAVEAEVDTAATYTVLPRDLLSRLGIEPTAVREFELGGPSGAASGPRTGALVKLVRRFRRIRRRRPNEGRSQRE